MMRSYLRVAVICALAWALLIATLAQGRAVDRDWYARDEIDADADSIAAPLPPLLASANVKRSLQWPALFNTENGSTKSKSKSKTKKAKTKSCKPKKPTKSDESGSSNSTSPSTGGTGPGSRSSCFPALDFTMPSEVPDSLDGWWCSQQDEYAFLGFSYDTSACPSLNQIRNDFGRMRAQFKSRYVRIYSVCDRPGFYDDLVTAAWENSMGLHMLLWFGFDGTDEWIGRKISMLETLKTNPAAPYVVRAVVVGSEPLYDWVLTPDGLAEQIYDFREQLAPWTKQGDTGMQVTLSDIAYGFQLHNDAPQVFAAVDVSEANVLPFLDPSASTAKKALSLLKRDYKYFADRNGGKKVYYTQTGWPSNDSVWKPNSKDAVASIAQERDYFNLLDEQCSWMKQQNGGGIGWFAHIWSDATLPGWGVLDNQGKLKFDFEPRTEC